MQEYEVTNAEGVKMTVQLDDDEAKRLGLTPVKAKAAPANKARAKVENKG